MNLISDKINDFQYTDQKRKHKTVWHHILRNENQIQERVYRILIDFHSTPCSFIKIQDTKFR